MKTKQCYKCENLIYSENREVEMCGQCAGTREPFETDGYPIPEFEEEEEKSGKNDEY
jgi:hypothetical protein